MHLLTIYVMTYEAPDKTARLLDSLLPFTSERTQIIVGDNSIVDDASHVVAERTSAFKGRITHTKPSCNIGLGTIFRAFELADSKYLWIVGCGDRFCPGALDTVEPILDRSDDAFIMFRVNDVKFRPWPTEVKTYDYFPDAFRDMELGPLTNINNVIYNVSHAREHIPTAYMAATSLVPHTAIIAASLNRVNNSQLIYHPIQVFERLPRSHAWDPRMLWSNLASIYPYPANEKEWRLVRSDLLKTHSSWIVDILWKMDLPPTLGLLQKTFGQFGLSSLPLLIRFVLLRLSQRSRTVHRASERLRAIPPLSSKMFSIASWKRALLRATTALHKQRSVGEGNSE